MPIYTIRKIYHFSEKVEVQAGTGREALELSEGLCCDSNMDDCLYSTEILGVSEDESQEER